MAPAYGPPFASFQAEIFLRGLGGERPGQPLAWAELAAEAERVADPQGWDYLAGGAGTADTMRANEEAFRRWRIVPRMLRDVSARDLSVTVLGTECPAPVGLAPVGVQTIVADDGDPGALSNDELDMLLFDLLQELIFLKDAERLLLRIREVQIDKRDDIYFLKATAEGEPLDAERHQQRADVKAVTLHDFFVEQTEGGWKARVLLDI